MSKKLTPTKIEYAINPDGAMGYNWSFYPGCLHKSQGICPVPNCWAETMSKRQLQDFHKPHLIPELLLAPLHRKKPSTILVNFTGDLFGDWVDPDEVVAVEMNKERGNQLFFLKQLVFGAIEQCPQHTFFFLTKNTRMKNNMDAFMRWGLFPDNAWLGISVCNQDMLDRALAILSRTKAKHKWLSFEPLLEEIVIKPHDLNGIGWTVIGAQSTPVLYPHTYWVEDIVQACLDTHIPVWLKENLVECLPLAPPFYVPPLELPDKNGTEMVYRQETPLLREVQKLC